MAQRPKQNFIAVHRVSKEVQWTWSLITARLLVIFSLENISNRSQIILTSSCFANILSQLAEAKLLQSNWARNSNQPSEPTSSAYWAWAYNQPTEPTSLQSMAVNLQCKDPLGIKDFFFWNATVNLKQSKFILSATSNLIFRNLLSSLWLSLECSNIKENGDNMKPWASTRRINPVIIEGDSSLRMYLSYTCIWY